MKNRTKARPTTFAHICYLTWQGFQDVVRTMLWEELAQDNSDERLAEMKEDIQQIRELLSDEHSGM